MGRCRCGLFYFRLHIRGNGCGVNINGNHSPWDKPCVGACSTTVADTVCRGCGRTVEEIRDWPTYTRDECVAVNHKAAERLRNYSRVGY